MKILSMRIFHVSQLAAVLLFTGCSISNVHRRTAPTDELVQWTTTGSPTEVAGHILEKFWNRDMPAPFTGFRAVREGDPLFPKHDQIILWAMHDPWLRQYPDSNQGAANVYLINPTDHFWDSEYEHDGRPAKFSCNFILHIQAIGTDRSEVKVFEFLPRVRLATSWTITRHGLMRVYEDHWVAATQREPDILRQLLH